MHRVVEILFFDGCPNTDAATDRVRTASAALNIPDIEVRLVRVDGVDEAARTCFLGSPSVRVDGVDVELEARTRRDFALQCRVYPNERGGFDGAPPVAWIRAALLGLDIAVTQVEADDGADALGCCTPAPDDGG